MRRNRPLSRKALQSILKDTTVIGYDNTMGTPAERSAACERVNQILALTKTAKPRPWGGRSDADHIVRRLRQQAADKISASLRIKACERLAVIAGMLPISELGDS